jgi:hypothetical protein
MKQATKTTLENLINRSLDIAAAQLAASGRIVTPDAMAQVIADVLAGPEFLGHFLAKPIVTEEDKQQFAEALMPYVEAWYAGRG